MVATTVGPFRDRWPAFFSNVVGVLFLGSSVWFAVGTILQRYSVGRGTAFAVADLAVAVADIIWARRMARYAAITGDTLVCSANRHVQVRIPVKDVSGLGLGYLQGAHVGVWQLAIWRASTGDQVFLFPVISAFRPPTHDKPITSSWAARVACRLYEAILERQGPSGPLNVERAECEPRPTMTNQAALTRVWLPSEDRVIAVGR